MYLYIVHVAIPFSEMCQVPKPCTEPEDESPLLQILRKVSKTLIMPCTDMHASSATPVNVYGSVVPTGSCVSRLFLHSCAWFVEDK